MPVVVWADKNGYTKRKNEDRWSGSVEAKALGVAMAPYVAGEGKWEDTVECVLFALAESGWFLRFDKYAVGDHPKAQFGQSEG